ncbi:hypothetical protein F2Q69_00035597 [Brassica cretica]|uniref:Uncharacterized protein n=1 Tax=Brassica cretica TaxID=69181 RepID=A0A8S9SJQ2_BRACR|nr:hypothetical protein F2Q69_00035597 [Brassica cretica]
MLLTRFITSYHMHKVHVVPYAFGGSSSSMMIWYTAISLSHFILQTADEKVKAKMKLQLDETVGTIFGMLLLNGGAVFWHLMPWH